MTPVTSEEFVGFDFILPDTLIPLGSSSRVTIVSWISPHEFYVQLKSYEFDYDDMMQKIQLFYGKRAPITKSPSIGSVVIVRHQNDNVLKRARIINHNPSLAKYKVQFIDYGEKTICQINDIFELEKSFTRLPALAICCSLPQVIRTKSNEDIRSIITSYVHEKEKVECEFLVTANNVTSVEVYIDGKSLHTSLIEANILIALSKGNWPVSSIQSSVNILKILFSLQI